MGSNNHASAGQFFDMPFKKDLQQFLPPVLMESFLGKVLNLTPSLITVYNLKTGKYVFINKSLKPLLGYDPREWIEKGVRFVTTKIHPEDINRIIEENRQAVEKDKSMKRKTDNRLIAEFEYRIMHANGIYKWFKTYGAVFDRDEKGEILHVINISLDITDLKEGEAKLQKLNEMLEETVEKRTQELSRSEKRFRSLIENSSDGIVLITATGKLTYASPGISGILGLSPEELLRIKNPAELIHKDDRKNVIKFFTLHFKKPDHKTAIRLRVKSKDAGYKWIEIVASNQLKNPDIKSVVINFRDVTNEIISQKRQQEEFKNAALRIELIETFSKKLDFRKTLDLSLQTIASKLETCLAKIWLYEKGQDALTLSSVYGDKELVQDHINQPRWSKVQNGRITKNNKSYLTNNVPGDKDIKDKAWVKKHGIKSFAGYPLVVDNNLIGILTLYSRNEISPQAHASLQLVANSLAQGIGRKYAESALEESEKKYFTIFETLAEGITLQDVSGKILAANPSAERILELNYDEMVKRSQKKKPKSQFIKEDYTPLPPEEFPFSRAIKTGKPQSNITVGITRENKTTWILVNSVPLQNEKGKIYAIASSFQDITDQKQLQRQKDEFISIASHELKTPITTIKSFNEIIKSQFKNNEKAERYLDRMGEEIDRLTQLVSDLLDVSKTQSGKLVFKRDYIDVRPFIEGIIDDIQPTTATHKLMIKKIVDGKIYMDKYRIYQVLANLISNAIKYSPKSDKIFIANKIEKDFMVFSVQDFGIGIFEKNLDKIFEPFFQAPTTIRQSHSGLGLGLYISREIINRHGGKIYVESRKGEGSTFSFTLPIYKAP